VDEAFLSLSSEDRKQAATGYDALVTNIPGICIGVTTADCVPLIAYDPARKVLATIHAGWRGTIARIVPKTIRVMVTDYGCLPTDILVGIGACISPGKFEVGEEVVDAFLRADIDLTDASFRNPATGKCHIDLQLVNKQLLLSEGILAENIETMPLCTQTRDDLFFSARRQGVKSGRMVTGGVLMR
jgi:YfiH family protein